MRFEAERKQALYEERPTPTGSVIRSLWSGHQLSVRMSRRGQMWLQVRLYFLLGLLFGIIYGVIVGISGALGKQIGTGLLGNKKITDIYGELSSTHNRDSSARLNVLLSVSLLRLEMVDSV